MSAPPLEPDTDEALALEGWFRDGAAPADSVLWWQLERHEALLTAQRAIFHASPALARLRLWVFLELMALPSARLSREALNQAFHQLRDEALDRVLKPLREADLLSWDASTQTYAITPLAQQLVAMLAPFSAEADSEDADLAALLSGVAGAHQLGLLQPGQLKHLQAQLQRLHDEFADAVASGSEFELRRANRRFERAIALVDRASDAIKAIIDQAQGNARLEKLARELGGAQARLLSMASQFNRALQQADRQRVTLGSTGVTTTDVRQWLQRVPLLADLLGDALCTGVQPVLVAAQELVDGAEAEFERDRPAKAASAGLPEAREAPAGQLDVAELPPEMAQMQTLLQTWAAAGLTAHDVAPAVLGGSYARAAYRAQLLPLLGDEQARHLKGATGDMARQPWGIHWQAEQGEVADEFVRWMSRGELLRDERG